MTTILFIQLLISFVVGGGFITLLSLIAEKTNEQISGIIMMFPTTLVLGFFFLGFTTTAEHVSAVVPATLIPLGIVVFSSIIYIHSSIYFATKIQNKVPQIVASLLTSIIIWFIMASPFAIYKFSNIAMGSLGFFAIITLSHFIFQSKKLNLTQKRHSYTKPQILLRAVFTGSIIAVVVFLGKVLNPFWGGIFTMFPAATFATLIILHFHYSPTELFYFMKNAPLGSISLFLYAISVMLLFPIFGIWIGTLISYFIALVFGLSLIKYNLSNG